MSWGTNTSENVGMKEEGKEVEEAREKGRVWGQVGGEEYVDVRDRERR